MPAMWRYSTRDPVSSSAGMIHFDCPRCGLTITPKASSVTVEHCPRCVSASGARTAPAPDAIVTRWVDAFNVWDLEGMLARFHPEVLFHPLRVAGLDRSYRGHEGVRRWFVRRTELRHEHVFVLSDVRGAGDDQVLAVGARAGARLGVRDYAVLRIASNHRRSDRGGAPLSHRPGHARTPRPGPMSACICRGKRPAQRASSRAWQRSSSATRQGKPMIGRPAREALGPGIVAPSCACVARRTGIAAWRGRAGDREE